MLLFFALGIHAEESNGAAAVPMDLRKHKVAHVLSGHEVFAVMTHMPYDENKFIFVFV